MLELKQSLADAPPAGSMVRSSFQPQIGLVKYDIFWFNSTILSPGTRCARPASVLRWTFRRFGLLQVASCIGPPAFLIPRLPSEHQKEKPDAYRSAQAYDWTLEEFTAQPKEEL